jgi:hypothetical protein
MSEPRVPKAIGRGGWGRHALLLLAFIVLPTVVLAAPKNFSDLAALLVNLLNGATGVLILAGLVLYFYGVSTNILKFGEGDTEVIRNYFLWGIIVLFLMVSIWGIVRLLQGTLFGGTGASNAATQQSAAQFMPPQYTQ